ncbi:MAG: hypothetical protein DYG89_24390 [Caldilinea sp. CFX5]|nr:hypothetical protein [Caldilinea sp. CFX5]
MVVVLVFLLLCSAVPAFAQDLPEPFCGNLSADDCDILVSAQEAALTVGSGVYNSEINFQLAGIPGLPVEEVSFNLTQDASYAVDPELMAELAAMQMMSAEEMAENMEAMVDLMLNLYATLAYDGEMNLTLPADIAALMSAQAGTPIPEEIRLQVRVVDGYGYLNLEDLAPFAPPDQAEQFQGWAGLDLLTLMKAGLQEGMQEGAMDSSMAGFGVGNFLNSEEGRAMIEPYLIVTRERADTVGDQDVAVFTNKIDVGKFVGSPLFRDLVISQLDVINEAADTNLTEQEVTEMLTMLTFVGPMLFTGLDFHTTQAVGLEDFYTYHSDVVFNWDLSSLVAVARMVDSSGEMGLSAIMGDVAPVINFEVATDTSDHNNAPEITAPEGAQIISPDALQ